MITGLDHVVLLVNDIGAAAAAYQTLFGCAPAWQSTGDGAERVLFTFDNMTLELMSPKGFSVAADRIRAVIAEQGEGLASVCFRTGDIAKMHRRLDRLALKPEPITDAESRDAASGATLSWKRTRAATEATRGVRLFFLEMAKERPRSVPRPTLRSPPWIMWWSHQRIPSGQPRSTVRGSGSTWRWTVRIRIGAG